MALQTSGTISLNDIHGEVNGLTSTLCTINDTDIRALNEASGKKEIAATFISLIGCLLIIKPPFLFEGNTLSTNDVLFLMT